MNNNRFLNGAVLGVIFGAICIVGFYFVTSFVIGVLTEISSNATNLKAKVVMLERELKNLKDVMSMQDVKKLTITAYSPTKIETDDTPLITASMNKVRHGIVAVSRDLFEQGWTFGKKVYIEGLGIFTIDDLMNKRFKNRVDVFMWDSKKALKFGKKERTVALLEYQ